MEDPTAGRLTPVRARDFALAELGEVAGDAHQAEASQADREEFLARLTGAWPALEDALGVPYGDLAPEDAARLRRGVVAALVEGWVGRSADLRALDRAREAAPDWFQRAEMVGYATYVDRFAGTLRGVGERLDYLEELGVRFLHLMPFLRTREGPDDGGYAISDYRRVDPALGSMDDLHDLGRQLRSRGMSLCGDLVLNHVAAEHEWAVRAAAGDAAASAMFHIFPDRSWPDRYEATLPEVFPTFAKGSFSELPDGRWVWTTFNDYQWDLNWANPTVFVEMLRILLFQANAGVEVVRMDAVAFLWKRVGTICQNQPEAHALLRALRSCTRIAAPAVAHLAEAIVSPDDLIPYLGTQGQPESDLAYHNSLMVQYWAALAPAHTGLMTETLRRFPEHPPRAAWATYLRCHDDIGWAVTDELANAVGIADAGAHRRWLADFYAGRWEGSFARGANFQENEATGDRRTSGSMASLAGLEAALEADDPRLIDLAISRILLGHALIYAYDGIPILWMGDEIGLRNDYGYVADPAHADDNRWLHRPPMDWPAAERRSGHGVEARVFTGLQRLAEARAAAPQLHAAVPLRIVEAADPRLIAFARPHPVAGALLAVFSFAAETVELPASALGEAELSAPLLELIRNEVVVPEDDHLELGPYQALWLVRAPTPSPSRPAGRGRRSAGG